MNTGLATTQLIPLANEQSQTATRSLPPLERAALGINTALQAEQRFPAIDDYIARTYFTFSVDETNLVERGHIFGV
jgi:hypothetical protein